MKRGLVGCAARDGSSTSSRRRSIAPMSPLKSQAAWITASTSGSLPTHRSGDAMSPATGVAPHSASFAAAASDRARAQTSCPHLMSSRTTAEPIDPVPPKTKTRTIRLLDVVLGRDACLIRRPHDCSVPAYCSATDTSLKLPQSHGLKKFLLHLFSPDRTVRRRFSPATD